MIGSAVGGYVDPDVIKGPRLKDAQVQTSMEGAPRPIVYGVSAVAGNIIQSGPLVETKKRKRTGKGGPVQETYHYSRSYAIRVCEGPIAGISRVWRDDKLVYDTRNPADWPDDPNVGVIDADSAKIASIMTIYTGTETQLPDPTLEALPAAHGGGVGNVPSYRGTAYVVFANDDLTERRGTVPQYRFEVVSVGSVTPPAGGDALHAGRLSEFVDDHWPLADDESDYTYHGTWTNGVGGGIVSGEKSSIQAVLDFYAAANHGSGGPGLGAPSHYVGYAANSGDNQGAQYTNTNTFDETAEQASVIDYESVLLLYQWVVPPSWTTTNAGSSCPVTTLGGAWVGVSNGAVERRVTLRTSLDYYSGVNCGDIGQGTGVIEGIYPICIEVRRKRVGPKASSFGMEIPDAPGYYTDADGNVSFVGALTEVSGTFRVLSQPGLTGTDPSLTYSHYEYGPALAPSDPDYSNETFWTAAYDAAVADGRLPAGWSYGGNYPQFVDSVWQSSSASLPQVNAGTVILSAVVTDLCGRVSLDASQLEVSQLTDIVPGFVCGTQMNASAAIKALQSGYFFDFPEWDKQLHGIKRGGAVLFDIPDDDLVESDSDEEVRAQAVEFPRKLNLIVPDSSAAYAPTKQTATRNTDNIRAVGEVTAELPINFPRDVAAQKAAIMLKLTWTDAEGRITRILPEEYTRLTPSDPFTHAGKRWRADRVEYRDGTVKVEAVRDRASVYTSGATSAPIQTPTAPISSTRGPTVFAAMNLPRLRTQDGSPGMYLAAQGILPGWQGAEIQMSVDGGLTYQSVAVITDPATIGTLTAPVGESGEPVQVKVYPGGELESVTDAQLAARENGFAITTDGVSEVGQFKTATETDTRTYDLTEVARGQLGTTAAAHTTGDQFVLLDGAVIFLPIDIIHAGKTLRFRPVSIGTAPENNPTYDVVYSPIFTAPATIDVYTDAGGEPYTNADGAPYYKVI